MVKGEIYKNKQGEYFLSLGFQQYAALSIELESHIIGEKDRSIILADFNFDT